jgi:chromosomal replication initiation ATPase DnaA
VDPKRIIAAVAEFYGLEGAWLSRRGDPHLARPVAAWLCRRETEASLRQLAEWLGLSRADSVPNLTRRLERRLKATPELSAELSAILRRKIAPDADKPQPTIIASRARGYRRGRNKKRG